MIDGSLIHFSYLVNAGVVSIEGPGSGRRAGASGAPGGVKQAMDTPIATLYTCGHSARAQEELLLMLQWQAIDQLIDIRRYPISRRHPQFTRDAWQTRLERAGIRYHWEGGVLGGRRAAKADSHHVGLSKNGLRGFADHMEGGAFTRRMQGIIATAAKARIVLMCAERLPEHCHRNLVADYLKLQGCRVVHLIETGQAREHRLHPLARKVGNVVVYNQGMTLPMELDCCREDP
ncbi:MAG: DUF488 family protein [Gammaproteobacteria bacterium]